MNIRLQELLQMTALILLGILLLLLTKNDSEPSAPHVESQAQANRGALLLIDPSSQTVNLQDLYGKTFHQWTKIGASNVELLPNCNLMTIQGRKPSFRKHEGASLESSVKEYNWNGHLQMSFKSEYILDSQAYRLQNGNTLLTTKLPLPLEEVNKIQDTTRKLLEINAAVVTEIDSTGEVIWKWQSWDHLDVNTCGAKKCLGQKGATLNHQELEKITDWLSIKTLNILPENQFFDQGDSRFRPGNLLMAVNSFAELLIVDRVSGSVVWRYHGDEPSGQVSGIQAEMLAKELPGAGNIILLNHDSEDLSGRSTILEINPSSQRVIWNYGVENKLHTGANARVQRLATGNSLIFNDRLGHLYELNSQKKIVWKSNLAVGTIGFFKFYPINSCSKFQESL